MSDNKARLPDEIQNQGAVADHTWTQPCSAVRRHISFTSPPGAGRQEMMYTHDRQEEPGGPMLCSQETEGDAADMLHFICSYEMSVAAKQKLLR